MQKQLINPKGNDELRDRKVIGGDNTNMINLTCIKYQWAKQLYKQMRENFWTPQIIDLTQDVLSYNELTPEELRAFDGILSYLVYLDSIQVSNLGYIMQRVTAPEIVSCLSEQISQEMLHNDSYRYVIETIIPADKWDYINNLWRNDKVLLARCNYISQPYQAYIDNPTEKNFIRAVIADYILEGIYFYQGFIFFYCLASRHKMLSTADMFKLINKDELAHVRLYQKIILELVNEGADIDHDWIYDFVNNAVSKEIEWGEYILGDRILGITNNSITQYNHYLANIRLKAIGLDHLFEDHVNPYKHLEKIADSSSDATTKVNFFDSKPAYQQSTVLTGWEDL